MATPMPPRVRLRPMTGAEFDGWREVTIQHHAAQVSRATGKPLDATIEDSRVLLGRMLPAGLATSDMDVFVLVDAFEHEVGWLWLGPSPSDPAEGFVFDIIIDAKVRGRGYGRAAMQAAEEFFGAQGKAGIGLEVASDNDPARALYESLGYRPISTAMSKPL